MLTTLHKTRKADQKFFYLPPVEIITALRQEQANKRNQSANGDAYAIFLYREIDGKLCQTELAHGYFPIYDPQKKSNESRAERASMQRLLTQLDDYMLKSAKDASFYINEKDDSRIDTSISHTCALFARSDNGLVGIGWFQRNGSTDDSHRMCAFLAYIIGCLNKDDSALKRSSQLLEGDAKKYADSIFKIKKWKWDREIRRTEI